MPSSMMWLATAIRITIAPVLIGALALLLVHVRFLFAPVGPSSASWDALKTAILQAFKAGAGDFVLESGPLDSGSARA